MEPHAGVVHWIRVEQFAGLEHEGYTAYRRIKYEVFVAEQGWSADTTEAAARLAKCDPFDHCGRFWLARVETGKPIGIVRGVPVREGFPHRDLFHQYLDVEPMRRILPRLGTVNALAVLAPYRSCRVRVVDKPWTGGIGSVLLLSCLQGLQAESVNVVIATTQGIVSARLFLRLGFRVLDAPRMTSLHPSFALMNVGLVLGSPAHRRAAEIRGVCPAINEMPCRDAADVLAYFESRHERVLSSRSLEELFNAHLS